MSDNMERNIRVVIADGDQEFRTALSGALQAEDGIEVVGTAASGTGALEQVRELAPDLLLTDLMLPELDGLSLLHRIVDNDTRSGYLSSRHLPAIWQRQSAAHWASAIFCASR